MKSKAATKATHKYDKKTYQSVSLRIRKDNVKVLQKLEEVPSKNAYIIGLIEQDITDNETIKELKKEFEKLKTQ